MKKVLVEVDEIDLDCVPSITVTCTQCGHEVEVYGDSEASIKRGCVMLREECPEDEHNFYTTDDDDY